MIPTIVSPLSPKTSGIKRLSDQPRQLHIIFLLTRKELILLEYCCSVNRERIKITAITAHMGPRIDESKTEGTNKISALVF